MRAALVALLALSPAVVAAQDTRRPLMPADQFALQEIGEIRISPDGSTIVFSVTTNDVAANKTTSRLMRVAASGGTPTRLDTPEDATNVRWSPDSRRIAFFAAREGRNAVWTYDLTSGQVTCVGESHRTNRFISKVGNMLAWSPDGTRLAFVGITAGTEPPPDPLLVTRLQYKTRTSFSDNAPMHILVVPVAGGMPTPLTSGEFDEHSIDWGGDGSEIVFLSNREPDPDANHNYDIFAVAVASGRVRRLTQTPGVEMEPRVSPDGRWIAYTATTRKMTTIDSVAEDAHVFAVPIQGGPVRELNHALDRRSSSPEWTPDSRAIVYTAADRGKSVLYRVSLQGGASVALIDRKAQAGPFSIAHDGSIALGLTEPVMPREIFRFGPETDLQQLTSLNSATVKTWRLVTPETIRFRSFDGAAVEAWYYPPVAGITAAPGSVPMLLSIHGGPHGMYGYGFDSGFQINASHGYATLVVNPRGSSGYGQAFADGTLGNWGGGDYKDLMAGVDYTLKLKPEIDRARLGVIGRSYGGFMTNWIITQTTRFKAAVSIASLSNLVSFYATSLYQDLVHAEFGGFPWDRDNFALLWKWSPLAYIKNVTTPTLFIHGEADNDVHITQAEEMFTALRRRGIDAALARYAREGHLFREPKHNLDRTERTLAWFDRFLKPAASKPTALAADSFLFAAAASAQTAAAAQTPAPTGQPPNPTAAQPPPAENAPAPEARREDVASLDAILAALYDVISGPAGKARDWNRFRSLFAPGARLIPTGRTPEGLGRITVTDPEGYITRSSAVLSQGFFEKEISREVDRFGAITHVFSTYETRRNADDTQLLARGINSIQLFNDGTRWWIVSIYWQAEQPDTPIPTEYLPKRR